RASRSDLEQFEQLLDDRAERVLSARRGAESLVDLPAQRERLAKGTRRPQQQRLDRNWPGCCLRRFLVDWTMTQNMRPVIVVKERGNLHDDAWMPALPARRGSTN